MNTTLYCRKATLLTMIAILGLTAAARAQQQTGALLTVTATNAKQLRQYTFKQRTETYHKGELKSAKIDEIHYSASGERVSIPLNEQKAETEPHRRGPGSRIIARKIEEKQSEMKDYIERLMSLASRYLASDPGKLQAVMANAEVTTGGETSQVRVAIRDYVKRGDLMVMSFDSITKRPAKTEISTTLDETPVSILLTFDQIRDGPSYPGRTVVRSAAKELEVRVLTYDYRL